MIAQKFKTKQMKNPTNPTTKKPVPQQKKKNRVTKISVHIVGWKEDPQSESYSETIAKLSHSLGFSSVLKNDPNTGIQSPHLQQEATAESWGKQPFTEIKC